MRHNRGAMVRLALAFGLVLLASGCVDFLGTGGGGAPSGDYAPGTGGLVASIVWVEHNPPDPSIASYAAAALPIANDPAYREVAPEGVVSIRGNVFGTDQFGDPFTVQQDFNAAAGQGTIQNIPIGSGHTLVLQGLDDSGTVIYQGESVTVDIVAGQTASAGTVTLFLVAWSSRAAMPTQRYNTAAVELNGLIYVIGGYDQDFTNLVPNVEAYNPGTDSWESIAELQVARASHVARAVEGKIVVFGGNVNEGQLSSVELYDPDTTFWSSGTDGPRERSAATSGVLDGQLYVLGGHVGAAVPVDVYDPIADTWRSKGNAATNRPEAGGEFLDGILLVAGGVVQDTNDDFPQTKALEAYDPASDTWSTRAPMRFARAQAGTVELNGELFVIGASNTNPLSVEAYNPDTDSWRPRNSLPNQGFFGAPAVTLNGLIYVFGAFQTLVYNPANDQTPEPSADITPPGNVTELTLTPDENQVTISWTNPGDGDLAGVRIVRREDGAYPADPINGVEIANVLVGEETTQTDFTAANGTTYRYSVFAYDAAGNHSGGARALTIPPSGPLTDNIFDLNGSGDPDGVNRFTWTNPDHPLFNGVRVARRDDGTFPAAPSDGTFTQDLGFTNTWDDFDVSIGTTYHYGFWAFDTAGNNVESGEFLIVTTGAGTTCTQAVSTYALYPTNGSQWTQYVVNDGATFLDSSGDACDALNDGPGYNACLHAGELRAIDVATATSCEGLTATDALGAFDWVCDDSTGTVRMVSTGLKADKNLSDLLDFDAVTLRGNFITVSDGSETVFTSESAVWWNNDVVESNDGGNLGGACSIHAVTEDPGADYSIGSSNVSLVVRPGVTLNGTQSGDNVHAGDAFEESIPHFFWLEGRIGESCDSCRVVSFAGNFGVARDVRVEGRGSTGFGISGSHGLFRNLSVSEANLRIASNGSSTSTASDNRFLGTTVAGGEIDIFSDGNLLSETKVSLSSSGRTIYVTGTNNRIIGATLSGWECCEGAITFQSVSNNFVANVTATNGYEAVQLFASGRTTLMNILAANMSHYGLEIQPSSNQSASNNQFVNLATAHAASGAILLSNSSNNSFSGLLKVGNACVVSSGFNPGLENSTCANNGASDATLSTGIDLSSAFVGKVTSDAANPNDIEGVSARDEISNLLSFDNAFRAWGLDGSDFPSTDHRGNCPFGNACRIWDWSLATEDVGDAGGAVALEVLALPSGDETLTHRWSASSQTACNDIAGAVWDGTAETCSTTFLRNAVEILEDRSGNENGLCESGETCLFTPNIGSYQGHDSLVSAGAFTDGAITGVTLLRYATNGRDPSLTGGAAFALYRNNGANWLDYVKNDGASRLTATGTACDSDNDGPGYYACLHGGEMRAFEVPDTTSCDGLTISDALGAFNWACDDSVNPVRAVSTGLADGKYLSDLIDFDTATWRANSVTVDNNGTAVFSSEETSWWSNPIVTANSSTSLTTAGTIYIFTADPGANFSIGGQVAVVVQPGLTFNGNDSGYPITTSNNFDWVEGTFAAACSSCEAVYFTSGSFNVMHNVRTDGTYGIRIDGSNSLGRYLAVNESNLDGLTITGSNNAIRDVTVTSAAQDGVFVSGSGHLFHRITSINSTSDVIEFDATASVIVELVAANGANHAVSISSISDVVLARVLSANNGQYGVRMVSVSNSVGLNITSVNNSAGIVLSNSSDPTLANATTTNNNSAGLVFDIVSGARVFNHASAHNSIWEIDVTDSSSNAFSGLLMVGAEVCKVTGGTNPGLVATTCANQGSSDATLTTGLNLTGAFVGKVVDDDAANPDDTSGVAAYEDITDWTSFDTPQRAWGLDGSPWPAADHRGPCDDGTQCRIWDWSLGTADFDLRDVLAIPTGDETITHTWSAGSEADCDAIRGGAWDGSTCTTTFLQNAVEIMFDGIGNDNGLCESNETCLYTPNIGYYQGHGDLVSAGSFTDGVISGVTLLQYETNGR